MNLNAEVVTGGVRVPDIWFPVSMVTQIGDTKCIPILRVAFCLHLNLIVLAFVQVKRDKWSVLKKNSILSRSVGD